MKDLRALAKGVHEHTCMCGTDLTDDDPGALCPRCRDELIDLRNARHLPRPPRKKERRTVNGRRYVYWRDTWRRDTPTPERGER